MRIKIDNKFFYHFSELSVQFSLDTFASVFKFDARFNPDNKDHQNIFQPLSYKKIEIFTNENELLLTGNIVNHKFTSSEKPELVSISGYSKSGILEDVSIPLSVYPLEKNEKSLREISSEFIGPFGIGQTIDHLVSNEMNLVYDKVVAQPNETVAGFLKKLAAQRNVIIGHTKKGEIYYFKAFTNQNPKRFFNTKNTLSSSISINGRDLHSSISVLRQPSDDNSSLRNFDTLLNQGKEDGSENEFDEDFELEVADRVKGIVGQFRPIIKTLSSGETTSVTPAANNILASEMKSLQVKLSLPKIDYDLKCGEMVEFQNKEMFIYRRQKFIVSSIKYDQTTNGEKMSIILLVPEAFTGEVPKNIFEI